MDGIIFNIQKFSLHDGPGIRTTIFFKGCPLKCGWCSNPESQLEKIQILYDQKKCIHCQSCINACQHKAIQMINDKIIIDHQKCTGCLSCVDSCFQNALDYEGENYIITYFLIFCLKYLFFY